MNQDLNIENPSLAKVLKDLIEAKLLEVNTAIPGKFVAYDKAKNLAQVQPVIQRKKNDGTLITVPVINNVPVYMPRSGKAILKIPVKVGDPCWIQFSQRSIDLWKLQGGITDPSDTRHHHLADAVAFPGVYPNTDQLPGEDTDLVLMNDKSEVRLTPGGAMKISNLATSDELMDLLVQLLDALTKVQTLTALGPQPFINLADFVALKPKFQNLKV